MTKFQLYYTLFILLFIVKNSFAQTPVIPNDPYFANQWGHHNKGNCVPRFGDGQLVGINDCDADLPEAWSLTTGGSNNVIAIIDTGVKFDHPELIGRFWQNNEEIPGNQIDDDHNGYVDDVDGWDFVDDDNNPVFTAGTALKDHGTRMAGIAAANTNNNQGIAGVDWKCKVMVLKTAVTGSEADLLQNTIDAIHYAADNGANFISLSYGFRLGYGNPVFSQSGLNDLETAINYALSKGVLTFAEPGNDDENVNDYPAASNNTVAVGIHSPCNERKRGGNSVSNSCDNDTRESITPSGARIPWGSNYGSHIDFVAPGVLLPAILNESIWEQSYGASMGPPFAAGIASLMLSVNPSLEPEEIVAIMRTTAVDLLSPGKDLETGYGRINAFSAVLKAKNFCKDDLMLSDLQFFNDFSLSAGQTITTGQNVNILSNVKGTLIAGKEIVLKEGFEMFSNSEFTARLENVSCSSVHRFENENEIITLSDHAKLDDELIRFYPNPSSDHVNVLISNIEYKVPFTLVDMHGQLVFRSDDLTKDSALLELTAKRLKQGLYIYQYSVNGSKKSGKLIKR